jgi:hypothetical protein
MKLSAKPGTGQAVDANAREPHVVTPADAIKNYFLVVEVLNPPMAGKHIMLMRTAQTL